MASYPNPTAQETKWLYTNAVIHELTHVLMSSAAHCPSSCTTCVWSYQINQNWTAGLLLNSIVYQGQRYAPWHTLQEINKMGKEMGYPPLP